MIAVQPALPGIDTSRQAVGGGAVAEDLEQWLTPAALAERVATWARIRSRMRVLEPSAGAGALARAAREWTAEPLTLVEIDGALVAGLRRDFSDATVYGADFLGWEPPTGAQAFDLGLLNPPFRLGAEFIVHALKFCARVVSIQPTSVLHTPDRFTGCWRQVAIERAAFLCARPRFIGPKDIQGATDFVIVDCRLLQPGESRPATQIEWWE